MPKLDTSVTFVISPCVINITTFSLIDLYLFVLQKVVPSTWIPMNVSQKFNGSKTDLFAVECNLPIPPINLGNYQVEGTPAARYFISVSNDGSHESEPVQMITFDPVCQVCNVSNGCSLKVRQKKKLIIFNIISCH